MRCDEIRKSLSDYLDGELPLDARRSVEEHLGGCEACRRELRELERTLGHLRSLPEVEPPPFYAESVMRKVREEARAKPGLLRKLFFPLRVKLPAEALAVALVAVVAIYVFKALGPEVAMKREVAMKPPAVATAPQTADEVASLGEMKEEEAAQAGEGLDAGKKMEEAVTGEGHAPEKAAEPEYEARRKAGPPLPRSSVMRDAAAPPPEAEAQRAEEPAREEFRLAKGAEGRAAGREDYEVSVRVPRLEGTEEALDAAVEGAGGKVIEKEASAGEMVYYVEIAPEKISALVRELGGLGDVGDVKTVSGAAGGGNVVVKIRLLERS
jgi:hypothetical protein